MIHLINDLPDNVLGIIIKGEITGKDYETLLIPAVEEKLKSYKKIKILCYLGSDFSLDMDAMVDDAKVGLKHFNAWDKVAVVSDHHLMNSFLKFFAHLIPSEIRVFKESEMEEAKKWIVADS